MNFLTVRECLFFFFNATTIASVLSFVFFLSFINSCIIFYSVLHSVRIYLVFYSSVRYFGCVFFVYPFSAFFSKYMVFFRVLVNVHLLDGCQVPNVAMKWWVRGRVREAMLSSSSIAQCCLISGKLFSRLLISCHHFVRVTESGTPSPLVHIPVYILTWLRAHLWLWCTAVKVLDKGRLHSRAWSEIPGHHEDGGLLPSRRKASNWPADPRNYRAQQEAISFVHLSDTNKSHYLAGVGCLLLHQKGISWKCSVHLILTR